ncbi:uncharacterized protein EV154DRAFT_503349 [Mucor mucedo]|uniref:uncharacterized protein n=1 Tax=Mucor mucedo TaxID=29922 RepID=UPI00221F4567|nr:uncharacterized protein EV154DRAFT_503349 [Mucor mucedo]KAI7892917.1 hypothetical protein EV154DRAFT_503349 [Mucor mucedo]
MINYFLCVNSFFYLIALSAGLFMSIMDLVAIEANGNLRPVVFFKTRQVTYVVFNMCIVVMFICIVACFILTGNMVYFNAIAMALICYVYNWLIFMPNNDRLCFLETYEEEDYSRKEHNHLIIRWSCLQAIKIFMVSATYLFVSMAKVPTEQ